MSLLYVSDHLLINHRRLLEVNLISEQNQVTAVGFLCSVSGPVVLVTHYCVVA